VSGVDGEADHDPRLAAADPGGETDPATQPDRSPGAGEPPASEPLEAGATAPQAVPPASPPLPSPPSPPLPADAADPLLAELLQELGEAIVETAAPVPRSGRASGAAATDLTVAVRPEAIARVAATLHSRFRYTQLVDLCGADYPHRQPRFEVIYHLYSFRENRRIRLKLRTDGESPVPSVTGVWRGAAWPEREVHDLFGIVFSGHPGLAPLLLWEGFAGHPLRKDFPLAGLDTGAARHPAPVSESSPDRPA